MKKGYKHVIDDKMKWLGDTDTTNKVIRINKKLHHKGWEKKHKGELIDTIEHEELHAKHPKAHEKTVRKMTKKAVKHLSKVTKHRLYGYYAK